MGQRVKYWRNRRHRLFSRLLPVLFLALGIASCRLAVRVDMDEVHSATREQLVEGWELYDIHCQDCHDLIEPVDHTYNEWHAFMRMYGPRTDLGQEGMHSVLRYLLWAKEKGATLSESP